MTPAYTRRINHDHFDTSFMVDGDCRRLGVPTASFFSELGRTASERIAAREAQAVCLSCPVRQACFDYAVDAQQDGIWGGTTREDRLHWLKHGRLPGEKR